jgi:DNA-binding MarR family transcriptional regulator
VSNEIAPPWLADELVAEHLPPGLLLELLQATRAYQRAWDLMDEAAVEQLGINRSDARGLDVLEAHGPMSAGELAEATSLSPAAITALVDRLEQQGYVQRRRDTTDRRRVVIELTPQARDATYELYGPLAAGFEWLRTLSAEQIELLRDYMVLGAELNLDNAARVRALPPRANARRRGTRPDPPPATP